MAIPARRRWQEVNKALKQAIKNEKLSWACRIRCCELYMLIQGLQLGEGNKRDRQDIRTLVEQDEFTRTLRDQLQQKSKANAVAAAKQFLSRADADDVEQEDEEITNER